MLRAPLLVCVVLAASLGACGSEDAASAPSGVRGTVLLGPQCPVVQDASPCPDEPLPGVVVRALHDGEPVAEVTSDDRGRYEIPLEPGAYVLRAVVPAGGVRSATPVAVVVPEEGFARATVHVDTGIR